MTVLTNVLSLIVACVVGVGPVALVAVLQNRRDRRAQALFHEVASQLPPEALRSDVALDVRCGLFSRLATVRLDLGRTASSHVGDGGPSPAGPAHLGSARGGRTRGRPSGRPAPSPHHGREPARHAAYRRLIPPAPREPIRSDPGRLERAPRPPLVATPGPAPPRRQVRGASTARPALALPPEHFVSPVEKGPDYPIGRAPPVLTSAKRSRKF